MSRLVATKAFVYDADAGKPLHDIVDSNGIRHLVGHGIRLAHGSADDNACGIAVGLVQRGTKAKRKEATKNVLAYLEQLGMPFEVCLTAPLEDDGESDGAPNESDEVTDGND